MKLSVAEGLDRVQATLRSPEPLNTLSLAEEDAAWLREQLSSEVQAYIGERATSDLFDRIGRADDHRKLSKRWGFADDFLGKRAAARALVLALPPSRRRAWED